MTNKLFIPLGAVIIALICSILVTSNKLIYVNNVYINHVSIISVLVFFLFTIANLVYGDVQTKVLYKTIVKCIAVNIVIVFSLLSFTSPLNKAVNTYVGAYNNIYNPWVFVYITFILFMSVNIVNYLFDNIEYLKTSFSKYYLVVKFLCYTAFNYVLYLSLYLFLYLCIDLDSMGYNLGLLYQFVSNLYFFNLQAFSMSLYIIIAVALGLTVLLCLLVYYHNNFARLSTESRCKSTSLSRNTHIQIPRPFVYMALLCVTLLINSHSICYKFIVLPLFNSVSASGVMFPFTFILADVVAEHYGYYASRTLIWSTLIAQFVFVFLVYIIHMMPYSDNWHNQVSFDILFDNLIPRQIIAASICVFFSFFIFGFLISILKTNMQNQRFIKRTFIANVIAKAVLCFFSYTILYYGKYEIGFIFSVIWHTWLLKMVVASLGTITLAIPLIYYLKLNDQRAYLYHHKYTPFELELSFK